MVKGMVSRIAILCFSAVFLVETVLVGVVHQHADVACTHDAAGDRVPGQADNALPAEAHSQHQHGACAHPGQDAERQSIAPREKTPAHDDDDCVVCRYLAERSLTVNWVRLPDTCDRVGHVDAPRQVVDVASPLNTHFSRGPPV